MDYSTSALAARSRHLPKWTSPGGPEIRDQDLMHTAWRVFKPECLSVMHILYTYSNVYLDQHIQSKINSHIDMSELPMKSIN